MGAQNFNFALNSSPFQLGLLDPNSVFMNKNFSTIEIYRQAIFFFGGGEEQLLPMLFSSLLRRHWQSGKRGVGQKMMCCMK